MSNEALETALSQKMAAEQEKFKAELLQLTPAQILDKAREYVTRENILLVLREYPGTEAQTKALLNSETPLADIYSEIEKQGSDYDINEIKECVEIYADAVLAAEAAKREALRNLPVYPYSGDYARENGELEQYRESHRANIACKEAIEAAISAHYQNNHLDRAAVTEVADHFGYDRMLFVLAATIRQKDWDERFSSGNREWARTYHISGGREADYNVNSHSVLTNAFLSTARHEYLLTQPLTVPEMRAEAQRLLDRLQSLTEPNSPNGTHFMAEISPDFLARASSQDTEVLQKFLPFKSLALTTMKDRKGVFAVIAGDENRDKKLREPRPSVLEKLQKPLSETSPNNSAKSREPEL